jgi:hypothetical protein
MSLSKQEFSNYIKQFHFRELFNDMGWNNDKTKQPIGVDNQTYTIESVAEKSGFKILLCNPLADGLLPDYSIRKKIENKVTKLFQEHLVIYFDAKKTEQIWQLVVRQTGKPTRVTETRYHISQDPELLYQRASGIFFELDEEEKITIVDVTKRVSDNFQQNNEKVTKQFYDKFKKEHTAFLKFIKGIDDKLNQDWYASLMLNRLMFCYFVQKKGFLDNDKNYLRNKLKACQEKKGKNKFYSFYRNFLLALFHQGLGAPEHSGELKDEIGRIPYLNGGLFDEHELEKTYNEIDIDDKAFEKLFDFFDQYEWHLDTRHTASGKDINPDVIGYIFEKYINDRAQMGAYYTKEDITDYISKNCIIPYLFEETKRQYPKAFSADGEIWQMVKQSNSNYIYDAVKKGVELTLPTEIEIGIDTSKPNLIERRKDWNKPATIEYALPTEIWREVIDRRSRYNETILKISNGEIIDINDFITYNLNIRQFAQDVVENTSDPDFLKFFYKSLTNVTVIDPTCGSGAFLFAALNILEPLYESCIQRMENFIAESAKGKFKFFEDVIAQVKSPEHPNLKYFIYKSIILRNLYGVDIMKEAVEIAKLRLFLKLVATVEANYRKPNLGLEPLPDIDFNIRAGNTLVGFATEIELQKGLMYTLDGAKAKPVIEEKCDIVSKAFARYKEIQLTFGDDYSQFKKAKEVLNSRLKELNQELNVLLHKQTLKLDYSVWLKSHQPFHWFAEFYEIVKEKGGFDVVIGNPPYVEYTKVSKTYKVNGYKTLPCGNLHAYCLERALKIKNSKGYLSFIVPLAIISTPRMETAIKLFKSNYDAYFSSYECRPAKLFEGADIRLSIAILKPKKGLTFNFFSTKLIKFSAVERDLLFENLSYVDLKFINVNYDLIPKLSSKLELSIYNKVYLLKKRISNYLSENKSNHKLYYSYGFRYWAKVLDNPTFFEGENADKSTGEKELNILDKENIHLIGSAMSSSLFYWYYVATSDAHNFTKHIIYSFPINDFESVDLKNVFKKYQKDLELNSNLKTANYKSTGTITYREYFVKKSKHIIDEIDTVLSNLYNFNCEELDFIINYDVKYRMGKGIGENEEDTIEDEENE